MTNLPSTEFKGTDLVPVPSGQFTKPEPVSLQNVSEGDLVLPRLLLAQPTSFEKLRENLHCEVMPGQFVNSITGTVLKPPLRALLVHHNPARALNPDPDKPEHKDLEVCVSRDAVTGSVYGSCARCEHAQWKGDRQNRIKPACVESAIFALMTPDGPAMLRVRKSTKENVGAIRNLLSAAKFDRAELWDRFLVVNCEKQTLRLRSGKEATFYTFMLNWERGSAVPEELRAQAKTVHDVLDMTYQSGRLVSEENEEAGEVPF